MILPTGSITNSVFIDEEVEIGKYTAIGYDVIFHGSTEHITSIDHNYVANYAGDLSLYSKGKIVLRKNFVPYVEFKSFLPKNFLSSYTLVVAPNENKASIYPNQKKIVVDTNIAKIKYRPALVFILGHELSHYKYHSNGYSNLMERKCDDESEKYMLACGYNPTQVKLAKEMLLNSDWRKKHYTKIRR